MIYIEVAEAEKSIEELLEKVISGINGRLEAFLHREGVLMRISQNSAL